VALVATALCGCAGKLDNPNRFAAAVGKYETGGAIQDAAMTSTPVADSVHHTATPTTPPDCVLAVFKNTCGQVGCHAKGSPQVDLVSADVGQRLIDQTSNSGTCKGHTYVSTDGSSSLLLDKLSNSPPCGARMPLGGMLSAANMQCLTTWVGSLSGGEQDAGTESDAGAGQ
jgi:hypothetical protein